MNYIDIHSHLVFNVDDGSKSLEQSIKYLKQAKKINLNKIICTPHMCHGKKDKALKMIENFKMIRDEASKLGIELYLGNEIMIIDETLDLLKHKKIATLNHSEYILVEFKRYEKRSFESTLEMLEELIDAGYKVILAHPELYVNYRKIEYMRALKESGVMLQMDATSILRKNKNYKLRRFCKKLIDERLIDIVASDCHCTKKRDFMSFKQAYLKIKRKDKKYANIIFYENPKCIINK